MPRRSEGNDIVVVVVAKRRGRAVVLTGHARGTPDVVIDVADGLSQRIRHGLGKTVRAVLHVNRASLAVRLPGHGLDPSVVIGTKIRQFKNRNFRVGNSNLLIIEACEYKRTFLHVHPDILVLTNIEADHLDYYKDLADYKNAFRELVKKVPKKRAIVIREKGAHLKDITGEATVIMIR